MLALGMFPAIATVSFAVGRRFSDRRLKIAMVSAIVLLTPIMLHQCDVSEYRGRFRGISSSSVSEAKRNRVFIQEVVPSPASFHYEGRSHRIQEAWIEWVTEVVNMRDTRPTGDIRLCFSLAGDSEIPASMRPWFQHTERRFDISRPHPGERVYKVLLSFHGESSIPEQVKIAAVEHGIRKISPAQEITFPLSPLPGFPWTSARNP